MIQLQPIRTDSPYYGFMESLLIASFPPEEYRELDCLRTFTDHTSLFHNNIILDEGTPVGLFTYWDFSDFYYIEHFAIHPDFRNGGYGSKVLQHFLSRFQRPVVLEVEIPVGEIEQRRIRFYERQGFLLWQAPYLQPPYRSGDEYLPMYLMVHGELQYDSDFEQVRDTIYREVYQV